MTTRILRPLAALCSALCLAACDNGGRESLPDTHVRVVNTAPNFVSLSFQRETRTQPVNLPFKAVSETLFYDEDTYDFNVHATLLDDVIPNIRSFEKKVVTGTEYTFALMQVGTGIEEAILEYPPLSPTSSESQVVLLHTGESLPAMSVHIVPLGTDVTGLPPIGTVGFRQSLPPFNMPNGNYELKLTDAANPANLLLSSGSITLPPGRTNLFFIVPEAEQTAAAESVLLVQDIGTTHLYDTNTPAQVRVINAAYDKLPRDVAVAGQFSPPLFPAVPIAVPTAYTPVPGGTVALNVTPPATPGTLELDTTITTSLARRYTLFITGEPGTLTRQLILDDRRVIPTLSTVRFYNAARQFTTGLEMYVTLTEDISTAGSVITLQPGTASVDIPDIPDSYQLTITLPGTKTPVAGPIPITYVDGGFHGVIITDGATGSTADVALIDDLVP